VLLSFVVGEVGIKGFMRFEVLVQGVEEDADDAGTGSPVGVTRLEEVRVEFVTYPGADSPLGLVVVEEVCEGERGHGEGSG
jgi:hypothetical protein